MKLQEATFNQETEQVTTTQDIHFKLLPIKTPLSISFGVFDGQVLIDLTDSEEEIMDAMIRIIIDETGGLIGMLVQGKVGVDKRLIKICTDLAKDQYKVLLNKLRKLEGV